MTVVVPTRGPAPFLAAALESLARNASPIEELIVVEDGTREVREEMLMGARLIRLASVGRSLARNAGVEAASTPLVAFLDADDISLRGRLEHQRRVLLTAPGAVLCFGRIKAVDERTRRLDEQTLFERYRFDRLLQRGATYESLLVDCPIYTSATMVIRDAFLEAGGYDVRLDAYEDLDLYLRLSQIGTLVPYTGEPVAFHRRHGRNTSSDDLYAGSLRLVEKHLPEACGQARRLILERRVDSLWGLGDFRGVRRHALSALAREPRLLGNPRFRKRLLSSAAPLPLLRARRAGRR